MVRFSSKLPDVTSTADGCFFASRCAGEFWPRAALPVMERKSVDQHPSPTACPAASWAGRPTAVPALSHLAHPPPGCYRDHLLNEPLTLESLSLRELQGQPKPASSEEPGPRGERGEWILVGRPSVLSRAQLRARATAAGPGKPTPAHGPVLSPTPPHPLCPLGKSLPRKNACF